MVGRISDSSLRDGKEGSKRIWKYGELVRKQQQAFIDGDASAALVTSTDQYDYSDPWHYDSPGYLDLGEQFAEAMLRLAAETSED